MESDSDVETSLKSPPTSEKAPPLATEESSVSLASSSSPTLLRRCYNYFMNQLKTLTPFLMIMLYSVAGAWIFMALERDHDVAERQRYRHRVEEARAILRDTVYNISTIERDSWNTTSLIVQAIQTYEDAIEFHLSEEETVWGFYNAILYAGAIYTTIGYGNIVCSTTSGRITSIFYAIIGIPLTLSVLNQLGTLLLKLMNNLTLASRQIFCSMCSKRQKLLRRDLSLRDRQSLEKDVEMGITTKSGDQEADDVEDEEEGAGELKAEHENNPPVLATMISMIGWLFFCAGIFCIWEDWDYFTSFYFFFISMSTIGFGDIVPDYPQYMVMNVGLVFIGLALVSVTVSVVQQKLEDIYMSILMKLLNEYVNRLSCGEDGISANVGMIRSFAKNKKAKFLLPFLTKGNKKLVMQRFQDEAKAKGVELPPTLTDLDPGTGLPNILNIEKKSDPFHQFDAVQQFMEKKEQELLSRRPSTRRLTLIVPPSANRIAPVVGGSVRHAACQTGDAIVQAQTAPSADFRLREASNQTGVNGGSARVVREIQTRSSLSMLRDSGSQTLAKSTSNRLSQTFGSSWRLQDSASQTLLCPTARRCTESQTNLPETVERSQQYGAYLGSLTSIGSQTYLERDDAYVQTFATPTYGSFRESGSQTIFRQSERSNQTGLSFFSLRESESQTTLETKVDSTAQTRPSETSDTSSQTRQSIYALRESQSQTLFQTRESPVQTRQSLFDIRHAQAQTAQPSASSAMVQTPTSYFETRHDSSQTICDWADESLQTVLEVDETGSQIEPETVETRVQAGQPFFQLRATESQTGLDVSERNTQTWSLVQAEAGAMQTDSQTVKDSREREVQAGSSLFDVANSATQASPRPSSPMHNIGVQTGILSRVAHLVSKSKASTESASPASPSTSPPLAPTFRQMSLQKLPPPVKRPPGINTPYSGVPGINAPYSGVAVATSRKRVTEERVQTTLALRRAQAVFDDRAAEANRRATSAADNLPSVRALATEFERKVKLQQSHDIDLPAHFPHLKKAALTKSAPAPSKGERRKSNDEGPSQGNGEGDK